jgi:hypothetical protein
MGQWLGDAQWGAYLHGLGCRLLVVVGSLRQGCGAWKFWGTRAVPLDSLVELRQLYFGWATTAASEENGSSVWCSKKVVGLLFFIVGRLRQDAHGFLHQSTSDFGLSKEDSQLDSQTDKRVRFNP